MSGYAAVFIDGGYLDYVLKGQFAQARIDYAALTRAMAGNDELMRAYYYHCLPYQASPPTEAEKARFASMQSFCNRLRRLDRFEVRLGKLAYRGLDAVGHPIFEQKRVDSMLAVDLVLLAAKRSIRKAVLFTGDSDFLPAVWTAKNEGVIVGLWHGTGAMQPHKRTPVTEALINTMRRP